MHYSAPLKTGAKYLAYLASSSIPFKFHMWPSEQTKKYDVTLMYLSIVLLETLNVCLAFTMLLTTHNHVKICLHVAVFKFNGVFLENQGRCGRPASGTACQCFQLQS